MRPAGLTNLDADELCAAAGGDPWKLDDELQAGDAGAINNLADAFHRSGNHVKEADDDFDKAKKKFNEGYRRNGSEHPINESAEVQRATAALAGHKEALPRIAASLEQVAASLATAQRDGDATIAAVNSALHEIDDQMSAAKTNRQDTGGLHKKAVEAVQSALKQITATRGSYVEQLRQAETAMTAQGYEPEVIDNVDGAPAGTPTQRASAANEKQLREARARTQADLDRMQRQLGTMLATDHNWNKDTLDKLADQISAAKDRLAQFDSVDQALGNAPETYLAQLDIPGDYHDKVHAAVAVGNPDTATNVSVTVPGVGSTTRGSLPDMVKEARSLRYETAYQLRKAGKPASVSTIAWMGYDPPPNPINTRSPADGLATMGDGQARAGAASLSSYLEQVHANNPNAHLTLLGHSYGSLTSSLALQQLNAEGLHPVNDVVFYGSPGLELTDAAQLGLGSGHAYVMGAPTDPIVKWIAPQSDMHGWGANPYDGMLPQLSAQAGPDAAGIYHPGVDSHADYARLFHTPDGQDVIRMSEYNLAAITAGLPDNKVLATPQLPSPGPPVLPPNLFPPNIPPRIVEGGG